MEHRALKVVAATTTLAEGVDLPFRVTILADWLTFDGDKSRPMESLLFKNIAGRCGRAGQFTEGDTIIFDNPVGRRATDVSRSTPCLAGRGLLPDVSARPHKRDQSIRPAGCSFNCRLPVVSCDFGESRGGQLGVVLSQTQFRSSDRWRRSCRGADSVGIRRDPRRSGWSAPCGCRKSSSAHTVRRGRK